jgi:hypothetical protein
MHRDHVPPKGLFEPFAQCQLITVPCCKQCNNAASKDDEYFIVYVAFRDSAKGNPQRDRLFKKVISKLEHTRKRKLSKGLLSDIRVIRRTTPTGIILPAALAMPINGLRIRNVVNRIVKGIYFHETGSRLPETHRVISYDELGFNNPSLELALYLTGIREFIGHLHTRPKKTIGNVFGYRWDSNPVDSANTMWFLEFFESIRFFCTSDLNGENLLQWPVTS